MKKKFYKKLFVIWWICWMITINKNEKFYNSLLYYKNTMLKMLKFFNFKILFNYFFNNNNSLNLNKSNYKIIICVSNVVLVLFCWMIYPILIKTNIVLFLSSFIQKLLYSIFYFNKKKCLEF